MLEVINPRINYNVIKLYLLRYKKGNRDIDVFTFDEKIDILRNGIEGYHIIVNGDEVIVVDDVNQKIFSNIDGTLDDFLEGLFEIWEEIEKW